AKGTCRNLLKTASRGMCPLRKRVSDRATRRVITAHPVDSPARRSRRRAQIDIACGGRVGVEAEERARHELEHGVRTTADVATDVVRVVALHLGRTHDRTREDAVAESRGEA